jgi:membrane-associated phospholipid phosphatase
MRCLTRAVVRAVVRPSLASCAILLAVAGADRAVADQVLDWNQIALSTVQGTSTPPPRAARNLAIMSAAVYDSVNAINRRFVPFQVNTFAPDANKDAAVIAASSTALAQLFPTQAAAINAERDARLGLITDSAAKAAGIALGDSIASTIVASRAADGATNPGGVTFPGSTDPGRYRPPADNPTNPVLPYWGGVQTFAVPSGATFRPSGPPGLMTAQYAAEVAEVKAIGSATGSTRTPEQTDIARAWAFNAGTITPPGAWNRITQQISAQQAWSIEDNARAFAALNVALADAAICAWDCKYILDRWRPVDAIRLGDQVASTAALDDDTWTPLLTTPTHPTYVSGHSTFSRAAAAVLQSLLGTDSVNVTFQGDFGIMRSITSLDAAANEGGMSRIYGGIHFMSDNIDGQWIGQSVASYVMANYFAVPAPGASALLAVTGLLAARRRRA